MFKTSMGLCQLGLVTAIASGSTLATGCVMDDGSGVETSETAQALVSGMPSGRHHFSIQWPTSGACMDLMGGLAGNPLQTYQCLHDPNDSTLASFNQSFHLLNGGLLEFTHVDGWYATTPAQPTSRVSVTQGVPWGYSAKWALSNGMLINGLLCLDVPYNNAIQGQQLWFWPCDGNPAQRWTTWDDGTIRLSENSNLCLDNSYNLSNNGNAIWLWPCTGSPAQQWHLYPEGLVNLSTGRCLDRDISRGGGPRSVAQLWSCNNTPQQYFWYLGPIQAWGLNACLDVRDGQGGNGGVIQTYPCLGNANQTFYYWP
jgi:hypothetical protein